MPFECAGMKTLLLLLFCPLALAAAEISPASMMKSAAEDFLASLDDSQKTKAAFPFDADERENFRFTPQTRSGLALKEMAEPQRMAAMKLLEAALSDKGKLKAMQVLTLEGVLAALENRPEYRDAGKYHVSVFGKPGADSGWGWKFEGHHLSLNYTVAKDGAVVVTPSFIGANPAEVREGPHKGLRVLGAEEDLARTLVHVLLEGGKTAVVFSTKAPAEILTAENRKATALEPVGVAAGEMTASQKKALHDLISEYTGRHRKELAEADMKKLSAAGIDKIRFGWAGGTQPGEPWYYRIQGPTFLMEAANTQNNANHIHTTWRDFEGDFGRDVLAEHYKQHQADGGHH
jgi:hypothetical protein